MRPPQPDALLVVEMGRKRSNSLPLQLPDEKLVGPRYTHCTMQPSAEPVRHSPPVRRPPKPYVPFKRYKCRRCKFIELGTLKLRDTPPHKPIPLPHSPACSGTPADTVSVASRMEEIPDDY